MPTLTPKRASPVAPDTHNSIALPDLLQTLQRILPWLLVLMGVALRLQRYLLGRSFRNDEAALAIAIQNHSLTQLISQPLPGGLTAPIGFLVLEKTFIQLLGAWDFVFRLPVLIAGCASVALMFVLARRLLAGPGLLFALGAFAINWMLLFYSSDLKQYATDVFLAVLLFLGLSTYLREATPRNAGLLVGFGVVAIACSHPSIFILAAILPVLFIQGRGDGNAIRRAMAVAVLWTAAFALLYFKYYRVVGQESGVVDYWNDLDALMPIPPWKDPAWFGIRLGSYFTSVAGLSAWTWLNLILFGLGIYAFYKRKQWPWSLALLLSALLTLAASGLVNYPFKGRLTLFLLPGTFLAMGAGLDWLVSQPRANHRAVRVAAYIATLALLSTSVSGTCQALRLRRSFPYREDIKPVLEFVQAHREPEDLMVIYDQATITYRYYAPHYGLKDARSISLRNYRNHPRRYRRAMDELPADGRTWFIFSSVLDMPDGTPARDFLLDYAVETGGEILLQYNYDRISFADLMLLR